MPRVMSDTELRHRKKIQGRISQATGALGLASVGAFGASKLPGAKVLTKTPALRRLGASRAMNSIDPKKAKDAALGLSTAGAGIGGAGSFNFASYTNAESRKRKQAVPVTKSHEGIEMGYYGEEGRPIKLPTIEVPIEKAWSAVATNYDPEAKRQKRSKNYETALEIGSAGAAGGAAAEAGTGLAMGAKNKRPGQIKASSLPSVKVSQGVRRAGALKHGKAAAGLAGASAVAAGGAALVNHHRKSSWQSYAKRDTSAFGVDHTDEVSKARKVSNDEWTEIKRGFRLRTGPQAARWAGKAGKLVPK